MRKDITWKPFMWLMPLLLGLVMFIAIAPAQVSADEHQNWVSSWDSPTATWTENDESGANYYTAQQPVALSDGLAVITYTTSGGKNQPKPELLGVDKKGVEGAVVAEEDNNYVRTATISNLAPGTTYMLHWAGGNINKLPNDLYLTFTVAEEGTPEAKPMQTWITFDASQIQWKEFSSGADWYEMKDTVAFDNDGNVIISYTVSGGKNFGAAHLQDANGDTVAEAECSDPLDTVSRTVTIRNLKQNTTYKLFWDDEEANQGESPQLSNDVYLTFTTAGPSQNWITWGTPKATWTGSDASGADLYMANDVVEFEEDDSLIIKYSVNGGRRYGHVQLQSEEGQAVEGASVTEPDESSRTVTITGLAPNTTYRLYWDKNKAIGERPHLSCDVYLTFKTGAIDPEALRVIGVKDTYEYTGSEITPDFTAKVGDKTLTEGTDYEVTYEGDRVNAGRTVTMTVTGKDGTDYAGKTKTREFKITKAQITPECVALPKGAGTAADGTVQYAYSGSEIKPAPVVTVNGRKLVRETDYILNYTEDADFVKVAAGKVLTVSVTAVPGSNYNGGATVKYTIIPKAVTPAVKLASTSYTYSGKAIYPSVTVKTGTKTLVKGTDYTASYTTTHKTVGKHGVKVTLKGNYKGTKTVSFKILPKKAVVAKATPGKKKLTVKLKTKVSTTGGKTYQIAYRVKGTSKWKYTTTTTQSKTIKKLKKGKKYQVKARAYKIVSKVRYYGAWSKTITTKKVK